jgi:hypothetical protein
MYGLALPRCRYEIVFKNAGKKAREWVRKAGDGMVCGPLGAAFSGLEVHVLSPCFYYRYRSIGCFDGAVMTLLLFIYLKQSSLARRFHCRFKLSGCNSLSRSRITAAPPRPPPAPVLGGSKKGAAKAAP